MLVKKYLKLLLKIFLILLILFILFFIILKIINTQSKNCNENEDCIFFRDNCCPSCDLGESVNKNYLPTLKLEYISKCLVQFPLVLMCQNIMIRCAQIYPTETFCNEQNKCDIRPNCELICKNKERYFDEDFFNVCDCDT